ncbi:MAG: nucleotidyltransferase family protein [Cyclobacteriaceae bacterium]|nr:nucleotidyltransferase family protein [Cyclobacteriaceae bacterium]
MRNYKDHLILKGASIKRALEKLDKLGIDAILFVVDQNDKLIGSLTDGDVRRGLLNELGTENIVDDFIQDNPKFIRKENYSLDEIISFRKGQFKVIPVLDPSRKIINILNFRLQQSYLPVDAVVMAGGKGTRLRPMTDLVPKPLLKIGDKTIIDHTIDRIRKFGIDDLWLSVGHFGEQLEDHFKDGSDKNVTINYVREDRPLGTIGAVSKIFNFQHDYVLITNSDILTNLNYEEFFKDFIEKDADMSVVTIPYSVDVPYAVVETSNHQIISFKEKPTFTYFSNGGIYLVKKEILNYIPKDIFYNSTDLMQALIVDKKKLISFPMRQYWLDIGKPADFQKAQNDIKHLDL